MEADVPVILAKRKEVASLEEKLKKFGLAWTLTQSEVKKAQQHYDAVKQDISEGIVQAEVVEQSGDDEVVEAVVVDEAPTDEDEVVEAVVVEPDVAADEAIVDAEVAEPDDVDEEEVVDAVVVDEAPADEEAVADAAEVGGDEAVADEAVVVESDAAVGVDEGEAEAVEAEPVMPPRPERDSGAAAEVPADDMGSVVVMRSDELDSAGRAGLEAERAAVEAQVERLDRQQRARDEVDLRLPKEDDPEAQAQVDADLGELLPKILKVIKEKYGTLADFQKKYNDTTKVLNDTDASLYELYNQIAFYLDPELDAKNKVLSIGQSYLAIAEHLRGQLPPEMQEIWDRVPAPQQQVEVEQDAVIDAGAAADADVQLAPPEPERRPRGVSDSAAIRSRTSRRQRRVSMPPLSRAEVISGLAMAAPTSVKEARQQWMEMKYSLKSIEERINKLDGSIKAGIVDGKLKIVRKGDESESCSLRLTENEKGAVIEFDAEKIKFVIETIKACGFKSFTLNSEEKWLQELSDEQRAELVQDFKQAGVDLFLVSAKDYQELLQGKITLNAGLFEPSSRVLSKMDEMRQVGGYTLRQFAAEYNRLAKKQDLDVTERELLRKFSEIRTAMDPHLKAIAANPQDPKVSENAQEIRNLLSRAGKTLGDVRAAQAVAATQAGGNRRAKSGAEPAARESSRVAEPRV